MEIIIYSDINNNQKDNLLKAISTVVDPPPLMIFDFEKLNQIMRSRFSGQVLIVFLISSKRELEFLALKQGSRFFTRYIIILPHDDKKMSSKALALYPRYLAYKSQEFKDVSEVVEKMIQNETLKASNKYRI